MKSNVFRRNSNTRRLLELRHCCRDHKIIVGLWPIGSMPGRLVWPAPSAKRTDHATARSSFSAPRVTILSASSRNGRCNAFAHPTVPHLDIALFIGGQDYRRPFAANYPSKVEIAHRQKD